MMARIERIERLLNEWAQWLIVGDGSGYPAKNVLHASWSPPSSGVMPALKERPSANAGKVHAAVRDLSTRLRNTVVVHYCLRLPVIEQAQRLACAQQTVHARIEEAHRILAGTLR
jgi:DNA-directed RNA polymerase specialized sigma24 family protein